MCGLEYVLITTTTITEELFVVFLDTQVKVIIALSLFNLFFIHNIIVDATWYSSSFLDLPTLPLIPYEFSCSGTEQSLLDCYKYPINCYSLHYSYYYVYGGVTCQGISYFYFYVYLFIL